MPIANIANFGAAPGSSAFSAQNAQAFRDALASGARRILIPEGTWWFAEILYLGNTWLPDTVEIFGEGVNATILRYNPTNDSIPAFKAAPNPTIARSSFHDFTLHGRVANAVNVVPVGMGIDLDNALFCRVRDVILWDFAVGVRFNSGAAGTYSGYNVLERFELNRCLNGININSGTNGDAIQNGRVWYSLVEFDAGGPGGAHETGVGIYVEGTVGPAGPTATAGVLISGVTVESTPVCLYMRAARDLSVVGCYFEPGNTPAANGTVRRRCLDMDAACERIHIVGTTTSEPTNPGGEHTWTPTYAALVPETRTDVQFSTFPGSGSSFTVNAYGAGLHGATAAHSNRIKNADMSRGTWQWPTLGAGGSQVVDAANFVIGGRSLRLTVGVDSSYSMYQDFTVDSGLRAVTVAVRYRLLSAVANAFRFELRDVATNTRLGFFSDPTVGGASSPWQVRSLTGRFDGLAGGVTGPRVLRVRIYPYGTSSPSPVGQQVLVDSVWLVDGEYAAPYRPYSEGIEILRGDDREVLFSGINASANF